LPGGGTDYVCYNSTGAVLLSGTSAFNPSLRKMKEEFSALDPLRGGYRTDPKERLKARV
jgi:hypothetical protein